MQHVESIEYYSVNDFVLDLSLSALEAASLCVCVGLLLLLCWGVEEPASELSSVRQLSVFEAFRR